MGFSEETRARLHENLERLLASAEAVAIEGAGSSSRNSTRSLCKLIAERLPLSHSTGRQPFLSIVEHDSLFSWPQLVRRGLARADPKAEPSVEETLGTVDSVFTDAAPFCYPETACGFLFRTELEQLRGDGALATPFDSGATRRFLRPDDSTAQQVAFVRTHELPAPDYRRVLETLLETCFTSPWDYLESRDPATWPIPVVGGDWRRWTFEVRFQDQIRLTGVLLAVFVPRSVASEFRVLRRISAWRRAGVEIKLYDPKDTQWQTLHELSIDHLKGSLQRTDS